MAKEKVPFLDETFSYQVQNVSKCLSSSQVRMLLITIGIILFIFHIHQDINVVGTQMSFRKSEIKDEYSLKVQRNIRNALADDAVRYADIPPLRKIGKQQFEVVPALHLSHCRILKSMSTVLTNMMCYIYNPEEFIRLNKSISTGLWEDRFCEPFNRADSFDDLERRLPFGYNNFAVVREPLSRFVSGYLDQCLRVKSCLGCTATDMFCVLSNLRRSLMERAADPSRVFPYDHALVHMAPQSWYCNMSKVYESTVFIKYESGEARGHMISEILSALKTFGVSENRIQFITDDLMSGKRTNHSTESWDDAMLTKDVIRSNSTLLSIFMEIFQHDYELFDFSNP